MPDAVRSAVLNGLPNRFLSEPLASVNRNVEILPLNIVKSFHVLFGRITALLARQIESHDSPLAKVNGFDLAGEEGGYPPKKHVEAFHYIQRQNFNITIHAGEGFGKESIWQAIQYCGAHRIGHGTRLIDDIAIADGKAVKLGDLAQYVLDKRIPLEICLLSNAHTGAARSLSEHPFKIFYQEKFRVTLNTDNRLMSNTNMVREFQAAADTFGLSLEDFEKITINAMKSAFLPYDRRCDLIYSVIKPGYAKVRSSLPAE